MKLFKKILSAITAVAIAVSACASMALTVSAKSIYDTAKEIESGKEVTKTPPSDQDCADYKVNVTGDGTLTLNITAKMWQFYVDVYDENGNLIDYSDKSGKSGTREWNSNYHHMYCTWNDTIEKFNGTISYPVSKGEYYIRIERCSNHGNGKLALTATLPSQKQEKINYIAINLEKGDSVSLGASFSEGSGTVTWKSSKPSVATISSNGKVTANAKGSAIITAKCGSSTKKIKIVVS